MQKVSVIRIIYKYLNNRGAFFKRPRIFKLNDNLRKGKVKQLLGIIGAMTVEVEALKQLMENVEIIKVSGIDFYRGTLCGKDVVVAVSGVGKVNAAVCAQTMIIIFKVSAVINIGVAGGLADTFKVGDIAIAEAVVEHDMDTAVFGDPVGFISGLNTVEIKCDEEITRKLKASVLNTGISRVETGIIASGDQFICSAEQKQKIIDNFNAIAAEMEGAAIGHACAMNNVPFGVLRAISDGADNGAQMSFEEFTVLAVKNSIAIILDFLKN